MLQVSEGQKGSSLIIIGPDNHGRDLSLLNSAASEQFTRFDSRHYLGSKTLIIMSMIAILLGAWAQWGNFEAAIDELCSYQWGLVYVIVGRLLLITNMLALLWRLALVLKYRPVKACDDPQLPTCTVIVPAYNEGAQVLWTLASVAKSDYPADKLQIIAIDDGSADDTWKWIEKAAEEFPGKIQTIRMPENRGKRHALYAGFLRSTGQVLVTIDSDSLVESQTLRRLVSPFYYDQNIGAVAGNVRILNYQEGIIPRMLDVSFAYSFEFIRASQSIVNTVFCTPGALAAYRREPLMKVLDTWVNQTFFGRSANIGEDRALTNLVLETGYHVTFQSNAIIYTKVPIRYQGLCRMFLRWARSNVRESLVMGRFIFKKFRQTSMAGARINFLLSCVNLIVPQFLLMGTLCCIFWQPGVFLAQVLLGSLIVACVPAIFYSYRRRSSNALWAFAHNLFWAAGLFWISFYSIFTVHNDRWLTRDLTDEDTLPRTTPPVRITGRGKIGPLVGIKAG